MMDSLRRLRGISKSNLVGFLRGKLEDENLAEQASAFFGEPLTVSDLQSKHFSQDDLIKLTANLDGITAEDIDFLHEEHRYKGMKTIYLHRHNFGPDDFRTIGFDGLSHYLMDAQCDQSGSLLPMKYRDFEIRETEQFNIDSQVIWETVYTYVASVEAIDPEAEETVVHDDLRFGFIWLNLTTQWAAISARDESIAITLSKMLSSILNGDIFRLQIPKEVIIIVEPYEQIRRTTHEDERGIKKRVTGPIPQYPEEVFEVQQRDKTQLRTSSSYDVELPDGTKFVLGYNGDKGIIYFSKDLRTSQLREFCVAKISDIFEAIVEIQARSPEILIELVASDVLSGKRIKTQENIAELGKKLAIARNSSMHEISLDEALVLELASIRRYFSCAIRAYCPECGEQEDIQCAQCGNRSFIPDHDGIHCDKCDTLIKHEAICLHGHQFQVNSFIELITLYPTSTLLSEIEQIIARASTVPFNRREEGFFIRGTVLHVLGRPGEQIVYLLSDIPEFNGITSYVPAEVEIVELSNLLKGYHERCKQMLTETCERCVDERIAPHCFMRLFGLYDKTYTPRPHSGHEFGDISLRVTVDGRPRRVMVVLLKSGNPHGRAITMQNDIGPKILAQFVRFLSEPSVEVLAIGIPQRIEDGFQAKLQYLAQDKGKKILFMQADEFTKLVGFVANQYGVSPYDL